MPNQLYYRLESFLKLISVPFFLPGILLVLAPISWAQEKGKPDADKETLPLPYRVDFKTITKEGGLPKGWTADDCVAVYKASFLAASDKGLHEARSPKLKLGSGFSLDLRALINDVDSQLIVILKGKGAKEVRMTFKSQFPSLLVSLDQATPVLCQVDRREGANIRFEREGTVCRLKVDGKTVIARRISGLGDFDPLILMLTGPSFVGSTGVRISKIALEPLGE